jgi:hypothetical protein
MGNQILSYFQYQLIQFTTNKAQTGISANVPMAGVESTST